MSCITNQFTFYRVNVLVNHWDKALFELKDHLKTIKDKIDDGEKIKAKTIVERVSTIAENLEEIYRNIEEEKTKLEEGCWFKKRGTGVRWTVYAFTGLAWIGELGAWIAEGVETWGKDESEGDENAVISINVIKWTLAGGAIILTSSATGLGFFYQKNKTAMERIKQLNNQDIEDTQDLLKWIKSLDKVMKLEKTRKKKKAPSIKKRKAAFKKCLKLYDQLPPNIQRKLPHKEDIVYHIIGKLLKNDHPLKPVYQRLQSYGLQNINSDQSTNSASSEDLENNLGEKDVRKTSDKTKKYKRQPPKFVGTIEDTDADDECLSVSDELDSDEIELSPRQALSDFQNILRMTGSMRCIPIGPNHAIDKEGKICDRPPPRTDDDDTEEGV